MPATSFKRKDTVVKAVRRNATAHLDAVISALAGTAADRLVVAQREMHRVLALLELVRRPLGGEVYQRERRVLVRALKTVAGPAVPMKMTALHSLAARSPAVNIDDLVARLSTQTTEPKAGKKKSGPDPKVLRLLADLAEMRMRARYWHLPAGEFKIIAPGLRASYTRAKKLAAEPATHEAVGAWCVLADQVQAIERAWPAVLSPLRKEIRSAERQARAYVTLNDLTELIGNHPDLRPRLDAELSAIENVIVAHRARIMAESPAAFVKRLGNYWDVWRGVEG